MKPYLWITDRYRIRILWALFFGVMILAWALNEHTPPGGWMSLEFPAWRDDATVAPGDWTTVQRESTFFGLGLDFLFLVLYPLYLSLLCSHASLHWSLPLWLARADNVFGRLILIAAPLDAAENIGLYWLIRGINDEALQWFITSVSAAKWVIALVCLLLAILTLAYRGLHMLRGVIESSD